MKKEELIKELEKLPDGAEICIPGYEGGYDSGFIVTESQEVLWDYNDEWYYGKHAPAVSYNLPSDKKVVIIHVLEKP